MATAQQGAPLLHAGSWQQPHDSLLKSATSDLLVQVAALQVQHPKVAQLAEEAHAAGSPGKTNSIDSSSTLHAHAAAGRPAGAGGALPPHLMDTGSLLPPLRQISLDVLRASELARDGGMRRQISLERSSNIFQDVFNELAGKDDLPPLQAGQLYTLPSMQFLESMLSDFDSRAAAAGLPAGPLDLPSDAFDLPELAAGGFGQLARHLSGVDLRPTPFDQAAAARELLIHQRAAAAYGGGSHRDSTSTAYTGTFVPMGAASSAPVAMQGPAGGGSSGSLGLGARAQSAYMGLGAADAHQQIMALQQQQLAYQLQQQQRRGGAPMRGPAAPAPAQQRATPRRQSHAYADFEYEEAEVSLQTSKSGRVRKVASFTGVKRRLDVAHGGNTVSDSRDSRGSAGADVSSGEVGSKGSKGARKGATGARGRKGRRTVCLNCGCHQTPQWRCGPLGPRTLCNACGVRYKKDLPLNCWPIRDGMVLPPGALLPPGFVVPPGITIHTQPADFE